ncbi:hypothetical protein JTB14_031712 [Gonioctena quinquepunctata]|nr:hypothetical protein JTB14_031712 [Gonioctena quinquepunctata]
MCQIAFLVINNVRNMTTIEGNIPAFSSWKMFNDTVPVLIKGECSETNLKKLATIIQSKECSNIFICAKDPTYTFEHYKKISEMYKAFTTWLLGQFFYLLGYEKFSKLHDIIVQTQICILDQLSGTQLHVYHEFSKEYCKAFDIIVNYYKNPVEKLVLEIFVPVKFDDLSLTLDLSQIFMEVTSGKNAGMVLSSLIKIIKYVLLENFTFYSFDDYTCITLDNLLFLFSEIIDKIQLDIIEIFIDLLTMTSHKFEDYNFEMRKRFLSFSSLFEQFVYKVYDLRMFEGEDKDRFDSLLTRFIKMNDRLKVFKNVNRINDFIFNVSSQHKEYSPSENVQKVVVEALGKMPMDYAKLLDHVDNIINFSNSTLLYFFKQPIYDDMFAKKDLSISLKLYKIESSRLWHNIQCKVIKAIQEHECVGTCNMESLFKFFESLSDLLMDIRLSLIKNIGNKCMFYFFEERELLLSFITKILSDAHSSDETSVVERALNFFLSFIHMTNSRNLDIIFTFLAFPLLRNICYKNDNQYPDNFICEAPIGDAKIVIRSFYKYLSSQQISKKLSLELVKNFFIVSSCGLLDLNSSQMKSIEKLYMQISKGILDSSDQECILLVIETIPYILTLFEEPQVVISDLWHPILSKRSNVGSTTAVFPKILCCTSSDFIKSIKWEKYSGLDLKIGCYVCTFNEKENMKDQHGNGIVVNCHKITLDVAVATLMLKQTLGAIASGTTNSKIEALETLPFFSCHVMQFHSTSVAKIWMELAGDQNKDVRKKFAEVIGPTLKFNQGNTVLSPEIKTEILNVLFTSILKLTKKSLKFSDFELQDTLLRTIEEISAIKSEYSKILLYFIMIPTSKFSMIAVNKCFKLAERNETSTTTIYSQNKKEFCEVIVQLCSVNQALINYSLSTSLEKVSLMLGHYGSKDFVSQESNYLLPFLVSKIVNMPAVTKLIQEMATMMELDISEMLSAKYGYVFIYVFLDKKIEDLSKCMIYLDQKSAMTGPSLRKRNFRIILNELLLNFHEKKEKVVQALSLLAHEDSENKSKSIPDYLHSHFLGVLLYFDVKLISKNPKKDKILLSLADLFRFMGSKHIMPLRFKIIAMLQTTNYGNFPNLHCEVWSSFIHTCEIESVGPQLALIFVSVLPLLERCPKEINSIFKYLIIENESKVKNYIPDLFFVKNSKVDHEVLLMIRNYLTFLEKCTLKEKIQRSLKYLTHEAMEVRIQGLKHLKAYLEKSREELDQMILDYNGIDPIIIELIDILTLGCREKDEALKLACGEVMGELGAIEPSHLPRRYVHDEKSFTFYINEDSFIVSSLNELLKAFQTEKNTQSMDRYALAIQEILKEYEISPDPNSAKISLWNDFPDAQKEVMLPLLSSRYMIAYPVLASNLPTPIYGTNSGASFQLWLYNWTSSLISSLPEERKALLKVILPSMKQDKRILMHFLPHILLHSLLEGNNRISEKCFIEIQTITSSFTKKKVLEQKVLNLRPIPISGLAAEPQVITPEDVKQMQCTKVVFLLLDFLDRWVREWQWQKGLAGISNEHYRIIKNFQRELCKLQLAKCNYHCGEYPRALMYLEDYITENKAELYNHLTFLAEIYAQLEEPDGVAGVTALQLNEPSVEQRILALEVSGKLADATTCYERMLQPLKLHHIQGLVQCYLDLDNVNTALNFVKGALNVQPKFGNMLLEMQAEPLWRLGQYDDLDKLLKTPDLVGNRSWGVQVGKALLHFKNEERTEFRTTIDGLLKQQVLSFGAASLEEGAYQHGYGYISKLHAINELQQVEKIVSDLLVRPNDQHYAENVMKKLMNEWTLRIKVRFNWDFFFQCMAKMLYVGI